MFNLLPGQGLGFTGSKLIAFGLGSMVLKEIPSLVTSSGGIFLDHIRYYDDVYSVQEDDEDIMEVLMLLFEVLE
jgi:hypothetical protein